MPAPKNFWQKNNLSIVLLILFFILLIAQSYTGWHEHNDWLKEHGQPTLYYTQYLSTGHFLQATFENWESEFLQMGAYVLLTIFLRQQGSSESKSLTEEEEVDREPDARRRNAPWPVKKGGWILNLYKSSLSVAFITLFLISFCLHTYGSFRDYNDEQQIKGKPQTSLPDYVSHSRLWFESFQNWQSEFIAVASIVILSIFLRQKGSPESKPVDAPHNETGSG